MPELLTCSLQGECSLSFQTDAILSQCGGKKASYLGLEYRFVPFVTTTNHSLCTEDEIDLDKGAYGIVTSPSYPNWTPNVGCERFMLAPPGHVIRIYINDFNIETENRNSTNKQ
jgi:hypothetical protein